jgi:hypothetical protein
MADAATASSSAITNRRHEINLEQEGGKKKTEYRKANMKSWYYNIIAY